jgi:hypothetical protein
MTDPGMSDTGPDSAMASGSDAGAPGEHGDRRPLRADEEAVLEVLEQDGGPVDGGFPEESEAAGRAADDEVPLPAEGGQQDDGLTPKFEAPGE